MIIYDDPSVLPRPMGIQTYALWRCQNLLITPAMLPLHWVNHWKGFWNSPQRSQKKLAVNRFHFHPSSNIHHPTSRDPKKGTVFFSKAPIFGHRGDDGLQGVVPGADVDRSPGRVAGEGLPAAQDHVVAQAHLGQGLAQAAAAHDHLRQMSSWTWGMLNNMFIIFIISYDLTNLTINVQNKLYIYILIYDVEREREIDIEETWRLDVILKEFRIVGDIIIIHNLYLENFENSISIENNIFTLTLKTIILHLQSVEDASQVYFWNVHRSWRHS